MLSVSAPKIKEFCSTVGYSKDPQKQDEFHNTLRASAKEAVNSSLMGAPFSRFWGSAVGCLFLEPKKWGNFASTLTLTADRVDDALQLTFAGMNAGMNRNPNIIIAPGNAIERYYHPLNPAQLALNKLIARIQPAIAADIVNESLPEDSKISERAYLGYFFASSAVKILATLGVILGCSVVAINRRS